MKTQKFRVFASFLLLASLIQPQKCMTAEPLHGPLENPLKMSLWPTDSSGKANVPGAKGDAAKGGSDADTPKLILHLVESDKPTPAVVVIPGGGYGGLASGHEGTDIANWLNSKGISAFICLYRHRNSGAGYGYPYPIMDAQRAVRTVRGNAKQWNVDPAKVGMIGFSAGGHLTTSVCTTEKIETGIEDDFESQSSRPDFAIVCYPVIALGQPYTHLGSQRNLLGDNVSTDRLAELSTERRVTKNTPPTFLWHTAEDQVVDPANAMVYYQALLDHKVPAELHIFQQGRHGLGLAKGTPVTETWPDLCLRWLQLQEIVGN